MQFTALITCIPEYVAPYSILGDFFLRMCEIIYRLVQELYSLGMLFEKLDMNNVSSGKRNRRKVSLFEGGISSFRWNVSLKHVCLPNASHQLTPINVPTNLINTFTVKGPKVKYHLTHKMTNTLHNYPVMLHLRCICHVLFTK
jgi:hypothetical protein